MTKLAHLITPRIRLSEAGEHMLLAYWLAAERDNVDYHLNYARQQLLAALAGDGVKVDAAFDVLVEDMACAIDGVNDYDTTDEDRARAALEAILSRVFKPTAEDKAEALRAAREERRAAV